MIYSVDEDEQDNQTIADAAFQAALNYHQDTCLNMERVRKNKVCSRQWKPVLPAKRLINEPKVLFSLERKKARIVTGLLEDSIQPAQNSTGTMQGKKVANWNKKIKGLRQKQHHSMDDYESINGSPRHSTPKKNPHMNFSLLYLSSRKKSIKEDDHHTKTKNRKSFVLSSRPKTCREKGSDAPYFQTIFGSTVGKKKSWNQIQLQERPKTSMTTFSGIAQRSPKSAFS